MKKGETLSGLLALPVKAKPGSEPEEDYDEEAEAADESTAAALGAAVREAMSGTDDAALSRAICDLLDWHMGEEPADAEESEMG